jgi:hypothetical protein
MRSFGVQSPSRAKQPRWFVGYNERWMTVDLPDWDVRVADADDAGAIATLRSPGSSGVADRDFERRVAAWVMAGFRTTWLAIVDGSAVGMASVLEYQRMPRPGRPDSSWG